MQTSERRPPAHSIGKLSERPAMRQIASRILRPGGAPAPGVSLLVTLGLGLGHQKHGELMALGLFEDFEALFGLFRHL